MITVDFKKLRLRKGMRALDIGCGSGRHTCAAYGCDEMFSVGVDLRFENVSEARERLDYHDRLGAHGGGCWALSVSDATKLPFANGAFDLVICSEVMEHIPDHAAVVREAVRVLRPGGDLVISVPRYLPEKICWLLSDDYFNANQGHIRIYRQKELIRLVESGGVRKWALHFAHSLHAPYWWLKCAVGPTREDSQLVNLYHRFLTWDIMKKPRFSRILDQLLNPLMGKSLVVYFHKAKTG